VVDAGGACGDNGAAADASIVEHVELMSVAAGEQPNRRAFLEGGGAMGAMMRAKDWSQTILGPPESWPQALRTAVRLLLNTGHPMYIFWGAEGACLYNDAYSHSIGPERHPVSLGQPARQVWDEIWPIIGPQIAQVMAGGPATWHENALVPITRNGRREDVYWTYSYGPIDDDTAPGGVGGVMVVCTETTDQVLAAQRVAEDNSRLARLFEQAPSFMAVLSGPEHVFDITNADYLKLIGHRNVLGKPVREALPEIAGQGFFELLDTVYRTGEPFVGRGILVHLQHEPDAALEDHYLDFIYQPVRGPEGQITGIFVQGHDITSQKSAELAAKASEGRFRLLAQSMPNHVWTALPDGNLDWFNDQVYAFSAAAPGELDGSKWTRLVHADDLAKAAAAWEAALASGEPYTTEFRLRRHDGVDRWHIARAAPIRDAAGNIQRWVGTNTDIEEQKAAEAALRDSELRVRLALESAEMGVWQCFVVGGRFVELTADDRALALLGGRPGEPAEFEDLVARIHPDDLARLTPAATQALLPDSDGALDLDYRVRPLGEEAERWVQARAQVVAGPDGLRVVGTVRDITAVKDAEAQQRLLRGELQHRIKNTLAMVAAIATQTLRGDDIADRREEFSARLKALASAHDMLLATTWTSAPLREVIAGAVEAHGSRHHRIEMRGPDLELSPRQALAMALAVHELATNAAKYGALSVDGGRVDISWSVAGPDGAPPETFEFAWRESGGPPVVAPSRQGFGTRLITRVLPGDFRGEVRIDYAAEGVVCVLVAPADVIAARPVAPVAPGAAAE
jgi:PAS domain S-box-containing protein